MADSGEAATTRALAAYLVRLVRVMCACDVAPTGYTGTTATDRVLGRPHMFCTREGK